MNIEIVVFFFSMVIFWENILLHQDSAFQDEESVGVVGGSSPGSSRGACQPTRFVNAPILLVFCGEGAFFAICPRISTFICQPNP